MTVARPAVSVLMPVRNAAATLPATLDSLLAQTHPAFELVAVNDGSSDATGEVLAAYATKAWPCPVRSVTLPPSGIVPALNAGLAVARGAYVARMDGDDLCHPERLARQAAYLDAHPETALVACRVAFGGDRAASGGYARYVDWTNTLLTHEQISLGRFRESPLAHPSVTFRKDAVLALGGYRDGPFPEDYELWLRMLDAGLGMHKLEAELLAWNDSPGRLSRTDPRYAVDSFYELKARYLARWLKRTNPHHPRVTVIGAGRVARKRADHLLAHGVVIDAYVDIDPRKVGKIVHGRPVLHREALETPGARFLVSFVAGHGVGGDITRFLTSRGYHPGRDFILAA